MVVVWAANVHAGTMGSEQLRLSAWAAWTADQDASPAAQQLLVVAANQGLPVMRVERLPASTAPQLAGISPLGCHASLHDEREPASVATPGLPAVPAPSRRPLASPPQPLITRPSAPSTGPATRAPSRTLSTSLPRSSTQWSAPRCSARSCRPRRPCASCSGSRAAATWCCVTGRVRRRGE